MNARFTIANKLIVGFGIVILATVINGLLIFSTLNENQKLNDQLMSVYNPSSAYLQELYSLINNSQMLVKNWVFIEKQEDTPDKKRLSQLHETDYPELYKKINNISTKWESWEKNIFDTISLSISDTLFQSHKMVMENLSSFSSYDDLMVLFEVTPMVEEGGQVIELTKNILSRIENLQKSIDAKAEASNYEMSDSFKWFQHFVVYAMVILSIIVIVAGFVTTRSIVIPVLELKKFLTTMTKGILPKEQLVTNNDEIGDMGDSLNGYIANMRMTSEFAVKIGTGEYNSEFEALSQKDILGNSLLEMRSNLKNAEQENKQRSELDSIRNWVTKGLAEFGDILRQNSDNMDKLSKTIMTKLVDYLEVNQGAIYILNQLDIEHPFFEMKSAIAYGREKFLKINFETNEGLVGRCAYEKMPVYLNEIPEDYIQLKSGLGSAEASYLLLIPLLVNDDVLGVIEIASFSEIPKHQIEFVTTLGENIASTISNVRINEQTKLLLDDSKLRADELSAQEEELRQNMEELQATQEEAARRENEMANTIEAINNTLGTIEVDHNGSILSINDNFIDLTQMNAGNLVGTQFIEIFASNNQYEKEIQQLWADLHMGKNGTLITNLIVSNREIWIKHSLNPFKDYSTGQLVKVIDFVIDITEQIELERKVEKANLKLV